MPMPRWSDEKEQTFREMWDAGLTCAEIAVRFGTTVSAICGKSYRLDLPERRPGIRVKSAA